LRRASIADRACAPDEDGEGLNPAKIVIALPSAGFLVAVGQVSAPPNIACRGAAGSAPGIRAFRRNTSNSKAAQTIGPTGAEGQ